MQLFLKPIQDSRKSMKKVVILLVAAGLGFGAVCPSEAMDAQSPDILDFGVSDFGTARGPLGDSPINGAFNTIDEHKINGVQRLYLGLSPFTNSTNSFTSPGYGAANIHMALTIPVAQNLAFTPFWINTSSNAWNVSDTAVHTPRDNTNIWGLVGEFSFDGFQISPYVLLAKTEPHALDMHEMSYFRGTDNFNSNKSIYQGVGLSLKHTALSPLRFTADFYYAHSDDNSGNIFSTLAGDYPIATNRESWYAMLGAEYATVFGTPALKGWYAYSNEGSLHNKSSFADAFSSAPWMNLTFNGTDAWAGEKYRITNTIDITEIANTWGLTAQWAGLSFIEDLSHDFALTSIRGSHHGRPPQSSLKNPQIDRSLTTKDYIVEADINTTYNIYQDLAAVLELSYIYKGLDEANWRQLISASGNENTNETLDIRNIWRTALNLRYSF